MDKHNGMLGEVNDMFDRAAPYHDSTEIFPSDVQELFRNFFEAFRAIGSRRVPGFNRRIEKAHRIGRQLMNHIN